MIIATKRRKQGNQNSTRDAHTYKNKPYQHQAYDEPPTLYPILLKAQRYTKTRVNNFKQLSCNGESEKKLLHHRRLRRLQDRKEQKVEYTYNKQARTK